MHALGGTYCESPVRASPHAWKSMRRGSVAGVRSTVHPPAATVRPRLLPLGQSVQCAPRSRPTMHSCRCALTDLLQGPPVPTESVHRHFFASNASPRSRPRVGPAGATSAASARPPGRRAASRASVAARRSPRISISNRAPASRRRWRARSRARSTSPTQWPYPPDVTQPTTLPSCHTGSSPMASASRGIDDERHESSRRARARDRAAPPRGR